MADTSSDHEHAWVEQGRYIPHTDRDFDPREQLVEPPRDEEGNIVPMDHENYTAPDPYVWLQCRDCGEQKRVKIPKAAYERLVRGLRDGSVASEKLSQLPLGELIPEMAEHQGLMSGAARIRYAESEG